MAKYTETIHIRVTPEQLKKLDGFVDRQGSDRNKAIRKFLDICLAQDLVVVPLTREESRFIESICDTAGVDAHEAVKMVMLAYSTLMESPLWKIVKPVDQILEEMKENVRGKVGGV